VKRTKRMDGEIEEEREGVGMGRDMIVPLYWYLSLFSLVFVSSRVVYCSMRKKEREGILSLPPYLTISSNRKQRRGVVTSAVVTDVQVVDGELVRGITASSSCGVVQRMFLPLYPLGVYVVFGFDVDGR